MAALIATLFTIVGGCVFIVLEKKDQFVRFWAMQSIFFGGLLLGISILIQIVSLILSIIPILGALIIFALWLAYMAFTVAWCIVYVLCAFKAFTKEEWEIPWVGKLARQQLARMDAAAPTA